jgi:hypothetical protein
MEHVAPAELVRQRRTREVALVDAVARAVVQDALLPLLGVDALAEGGVDDDQLVGDATRLLQEPLPLIAQEMAVEMAGEQPVELAACEGKRHGVAPDDPGAGQAGRGDLDHRGALIEPDDLAA